VNYENYEEILTKWCLVQLRKIIIHPKISLKNIRKIVFVIVLEMEIGGSIIIIKKTKE
jgi:hypothetical protein